jgi:hypothetical protein
MTAGEAAQAMPCDTGYVCKSASGKIQIELNRCRYVNRLRLLSLKIDNKTVDGAELNASWDGKSVGDNLLAFEINLPTAEGSSKVISAEIGKGKMQGVLKVKFAVDEPGTYKVLRTESITCGIDDL